MLKKKKKDNNTVNKLRCQPYQLTDLRQVLLRLILDAGVLKSACKETQRKITRNTQTDTRLTVTMPEITPQAPRLFPLDGLHLGWRGNTMSKHRVCGAEALITCVFSCTSSSCCCCPELLAKSEKPWSENTDSDAASFGKKYLHGTYWPGFTF